MYDVYHACVILAIISCISSLKPCGPLVQNIPLETGCTPPGQFKLPQWRIQALWILYNFLPLRGCVLVTVGMFSHWTENLSLQTGYCPSVAKILWKRLSLSGELLSQTSEWLEAYLTGQLLPQVCTVWLVLQHYSTDQPHSSGLVKGTNDIIKTQLARFVEALNYLGQSIAFWSFWITDPLCLEHINSPLRQSQDSHLAPASFDPPLIRGEILWYFNTPCNRDVTSIGRNTSRRTHLYLAGKASIRYC